MKFFNLASSALVVALIAMPLAAQPGGKGQCPQGKREGKGKNHMMWKSLNLTEQQKTKLEKLHEGHQAERGKHKEEMKVVRDKIREELGKETPDASKLKKYAEQTSDLVAGMTQKRLDHLLEVKKILNKEQFEKILNKEWKHGPRPGEAKCGKKNCSPKRGDPHNKGKRKM